MANGPKYTNQQLRSVSLEAYFPGRLGAFAALGEVQRAVHEKLPNLFVPNVQAGEAIALRPYQLRDQRQSRSLAIAVNQVAYISYDYPGYPAFRTEALEMMEIGLRALGPSKLNRVVYRYENEVGVAREQDGSLPLLRLFPKVVPVVLADTNCRALNAEFEHDWRDGAHHGVRGFHARVEPGARGEVLRVSVYAGVVDCSAASLQVVADKAHEVGFALFESLISDEFRKFISSDGEESK